MANNKVVEIVESVAGPIAEELGYELVDVEFVHEGTNWFLRVFIDKPGAITLDDCEAVHRPLSDKLDELDPIPQAYMMEVSSPGVERPFKKPGDYEKALGEKVRIRLYKPINGQKTLEGVLKGFNGETISVLTDDDTMKTLPLNVISKINRMILF